MRTYKLSLDRERELIYDFGAWEQIARYYAPDGQAFDMAQVKVQPQDIPFLVWAGLIWEDPQLTQDQVKTLLNQAMRQRRLTVLDLLKVVTSAIFASFGVPEPEETASAASPAKKKH